ncbi:MAG TPA: glycoside hydrolase family 92 protein, partial [Bacteroidales bacterium]|nr:glycoside hydrolase family 92 protein [Bacteroidales bacterium]
PNILNDVNGEYPAMGSHKTMMIKDENARFTVFSLWDTYRTLHPFFTLVYPEIQDQMCRSIMDMYKENGWLPQWELISRETHVMVGDPASIVLTDSYLKGIHYDNPDTILRAMVHNAENFYIMKQWGYPDVHHIRRGMVPYLDHDGWIPYDYKEKHPWLWASVATTQEYNLADWNISRMAKLTGHPNVEQRFKKRSLGYKHLYDPNSMFFRQRYADGSWVEPFDPMSRYYEMPWKFSGGPGYCEGMAWQYNFFIPHDIPGVIDLMGGSKAFINRLQMVFDSGYYDPSNEPDIAFPFLFNYVKGEEWRTQETVRNIIDTTFTTEPGGIPGNDDTGTMSSWLMFAMMGIYPDCPGNPQYQVSTPVFEKITIRLNPAYYKGKEFVIRCDGNPETQKYIDSITENGHPHNDFTLEHSDIVNGGELMVHLKDVK